jgi:hypothetical protein
VLLIKSGGSKEGILPLVAAEFGTSGYEEFEEVLDDTPGFKPKSFRKDVDQFSLIFSRGS